MQIPHLTPNTTKGGLLWVIFILLLAMIPRIYQWLNPASTIIVSKSIEKKMASYTKEKAYYKAKKHQQNLRFKSPPHKFNPNEYSVADWMYLGLSLKQSNVVISFCKKPLKSNEDLKKIFVIPSELFDLIKDSTFYPSIMPQKQKPLYRNEITRVAKPFVSIMVGKMDSTSLVQISGIGPFYAHMIMQYERALGGFYKKEQLMEVYKMTEEIFLVLCKHIDFSNPKIRKISINAADFQLLNKHPYIDKWQANSIINMRKQLGGYQNIKELQKSHLISAEDFVKLEPYVSL